MVLAKENPNHQLDSTKWVDEYGDSLYSYAFFRLQDKGVAEELVQETFLAALTARSNFRGESSEKTWFFSILKNKIVDHLRKKYREISQPEEKLENSFGQDVFDQKGGWLHKPSKWRSNPQDTFEQVEFMGILEQCLGHLPVKQRDAFVLRELEENESEEICKVLMVSPSNYWVLLHRARLLIRKCLEKGWFGN